MLSLARHGRFGNAVLQYAFLRCFCARHGFRWETPNWVGRKLFGLDDTFVRGRPPVVLFDDVGLMTRLGIARDRCHDRRVLRATKAASDGVTAYALVDPGLDPEVPSLEFPFSHADLEGLFLVHGRHLRPHRKMIRSIFRPIPAVQARGAAIVDRLRSDGSTLIGIHVRRGDFATSNLNQRFELLTPVPVYAAWIRALWPTLRRPKLFVATDSPELVLPELAEFQPVTSQALGFSVEDLVPGGKGGVEADRLGFIPRADFFPDWYLLSQMDVLAVSNSTFSFSAALLNERARLFVRPTFDWPSLQAFDPWDAEPLLFSRLHRTLAGDLGSRLSMTLAATNVRSWRSTVLKFAGVYAETLRRRRTSVHRSGGRWGLVREVLDPRHYIVAGRQYPLPTRED